MTEPVFISHASKDRQIAQTICTALENRHLPCWLASRDVGPGENFQEAIVRTIRTAKVMVLVFSGAANNSNEIKKELALASRQGLVVIPARVEDIMPSEALSYELATRQWINLFDNWEREMERLAAWIAGIVSVASPTKPDSSPEFSHQPPPAKPETAAPETSPQPQAVTIATIATDAAPLLDDAKEDGRGPRIASLLLIGWGVVRLGFAVNAAFQIPIAVLQYRTHVLLTSIIVPGLLGGATIGAGVLAIRRAGVARSFGLAVCAICLLYGLYAFASLLVVMWTRPIAVSPLVWIMTLVSLAIYLTALVLLARWRPRRDVEPDG